MNISYGKIASNLALGIKVTQEPGNKIDFSKDGLPPVCCNIPLNNKSEILLEALTGYLDCFKDDFKKFLQNEILTSKQKQSFNRILDPQKIFD
ncbi:hypothetical protein [Fibrobacter sp. UBA3718]|uniref:hypothetical protein n=1 Tax=Fibrobacter sp. UBA3718 TaxID=1946531 RepID=UPI0025BFA2DF|nr:hypothetical protein [Fibrobacter sp. UBA3718]